MTIIISPYSQTLRNGKVNPKNYPYWQELINLLAPNNSILQIGRGSEERFANVQYFYDRPMEELKRLIRAMDTFIAVDNFFPHMCHHYGKHGIVLFGQSDPRIYGYPENLNLFKSEKYFRPDQFGLWESCDFKKEAFVEPENVLKAINNI